MRSRRWDVCLACLILLGCGEKDGMGNEESGSSGTGEEGGDGDGDCREDEFGTVMIELQRSSSELEDPFVGTASIRVFLDYQDCLADFYVNQHPEFQIDGVEGGPVFETWADGCLCDSSYAKPVIDCGVDEMVQTINTQGAMDITRLQIGYDVASDDLEGTQIPFGPLPTEALAGCSPLVRLSGASVQGFDAGDNQIWQIASFDNATARVGQGASIQIFVERSN